MRQEIKLDAKGAVALECAFALYAVAEKRAAGRLKSVEALRARADQIARRSVSDLREATADRQRRLNEVLGAEIAATGAAVCLDAKLVRENGRVVALSFENGRDPERERLELEKAAAIAKKKETEEQNMIAETVQKLGENGKTRLAAKQGV